MWPCAARAANDAIAGSTPSTSTSACATCAVEGVASMRWRQRERMVGSTSSVLGAHSTHTVPGVGSSMLLSSVLALSALSRSASSSTKTCHGARDGAIAERITSSRVSATA